MKLNEVTEPGFYKTVKDSTFDMVIEVLPNQDEKWLKEYPQHKLVVVEWMYDYTNKDGRKIYGTSGIQTAVQNTSKAQVEKLNREYKIFGPMNANLMDMTPTANDRCKAVIEQIKKDIERLENGNYDTNDFICDLKDYLRMLGNEDE